MQATGVDVAPPLGTDSLLAEAAERHGDRPAIAYGELVLTFAELDAAVERLADELRPCLPAGERARVAVVAPNAPAAVIGMFAAWRAGGVAVPLSARLREFDLGRILENAEPAAAVAVERHAGFSFRDALARAAVALPSLHCTILVDGAGDVTAIDRPPDPGAGDAPPATVTDGTASILYTSGTTGPAKGALATHAAAMHAARELRTVLELDERDACALVIPVQHAFGLACLLTSIAAGSLAVLVESSTSLGPLLGALDAHKASVLHGSPALFTALLAARTEGVPSVRTGLTGGAHCPPALLERLDATGATILNCWGMTEIGAAAACRRSDPSHVRHHTVGRPLSGYELRIAGGEVQVRSPHVTPGYHRAPEATAAAFDGEWLRTGDVGSLDEAGNLTIAGRAKELVNVAGFNVFPGEVESFLLTHPGVVQAVVVGVADERRGEALRAFVVPREGVALAPADLLRFARSRIAGYKIPYAIAIVEELPLLASGKPDRAALARSAQEVAGATA